MTDEELLYKFEERAAICMEDGCQPTLMAKKIARVECINALVDRGVKRSDAIYRLHKLTRNVN